MTTIIFLSGCMFAICDGMNQTLKWKIVLKIVGSIGKFYPMSGKVGKKERLAVIITGKQIVWKLFNMNWTFIEKNVFDMLSRCDN